MRILSYKDLENPPNYDSGELFSILKKIKSNILHPVRLYIKYLMKPIYCVALFLKSKLL